MVRIGLNPQYPRRAHPPIRAATLQPPEQAGKQPRIPGSGYKFNNRAIQILVPLLLFKIFIFWLTLVSPQLLPLSFRFDNYQANPHWPENHTPGLAERFKTWDSQHYLHLSQTGYEPNSLSAAFYPLWPAMIAATRPLFGGHSLFAALVMANLFSLFGWILFHRLVAEDFGEDLADWALVFLIAFPGSLFFGFPYSESLFFFLVMMFFWGMRRNNFLLQAVSGFFLPLTRAVGILCLFPFLVHHATRRSRLRDYWLGLAFLAGFGATLLVMRLTTGNCLEGFEAQKLYLSHATFSKIFEIHAFLKVLFAPFKIFDFPLSIFDRIFFILFGAALIPLYKLNKTYFTYALIMGLVPALTHTLISFTRYCAVVFPLYIFLAQWFSNRERKNDRFVVVAALFAIQIIFLFLHINNIWVG